MLLTIFTRESILLSAPLSRRNYVRPSVPPSHGWISQNGASIESSNLHRRLPERL